MSRSTVSADQEQVGTKLRDAQTELFDELRPFLFTALEGDHDTQVAQIVVDQRTLDSRALNRLQVGDSLQLEARINDVVQLVCQGKVIAEGSLIVVDDMVGIQIGKKCD
ncbi:MAG: FliM/FliN family flagellar motor switch protein [Planctomycetales bacterium]|nr:FliM/FliN family flagellar motor switch protein [Planctomycetales bacterium]